MRILQRIFLISLLSAFALAPLYAYAQTYTSGMQGGTVSTIAGAASGALETAGIAGLLPQDECALTGNAGAVCGTITSNTTYKAGRLDPGTALSPVDVWNICRYVDNTSTNGISHPIFWNSAREWQAICSGTHQDLSVNYCARPEVPVLPPGPGCGTPVLKTAAAALPYSRVTSNAAAGVVETAQYTCTNTPTGCTSSVQWTEIVSATYLPSQASPDLPKTDASWKSGWTVSGSYSYDDSQKPSSCTTASCGPAATIPTTTQPTTGLCATGSAGAVSGSNMVLSEESEVWDGALTSICTTANGYVSRWGSCTGGTGSACSKPGPCVSNYSCTFVYARTCDPTSWTWTCTDPNGGTPVTCSTPTSPTQLSTSGQCGTANGSITASAPTTGLCADGSTPTVTLSSNQDYFTWTCSGTNGTAASCSAINNPRILAGCYVDTMAWDPWTEGSCTSENGASCTQTGAIIFSVGTAFGTNPYGFAPDGVYFPDYTRYQQTWITCPNAADVGTASCSIWNAPNGNFAAQVVVVDTLTHQTQSFTINAQKFLNFSSTGSCGNRAPL